MDMIERAFRELYPEKEYNFSGKIKYSGKFRDYNANVRLNSFSREIYFSLSKNWKSVSPDIKIGLLQELMIKLFKQKNHTISMDLYNTFMKNIHIAAPKLESDPKLVEAFNRINDEYFYGMMEMPNMIWGQNSLRKLGSYQYGSDTVSISRVLDDAPRHLLDYVVYHELLHKKHKFSHKNGRNLHHSPEFRKQEKLYTNQPLVEKELTAYLRRQPRNIIQKQKKRYFWEKFF
jgi:hypothetical protein